ncbi:hypothetical protein [Thermococcus celer]|uniref:Uncharacterized protein n=1 Tax=Thermococcus celer Vu 13 = JCM 8558 TaxID=1293037 RepID=A0A218P2S2_THECE|nr:hypothetical protein [Thermococcus celer]ASI99209.1 hypothetical protein A3L02_06345 [Thermococcus celer Vu 13 = JCM 8558]
MDNVYFFAFLLGLYGYIEFVLLLITAKRSFLGGTDFFWPRIRRYVDAPVGALSLLLSLRTGGGFKLILALYGVSLLLVSARDVLRLSNRPVTVRKAFNYVANSYIVLAIFLMGPWLGSVLPVEPTIVLVIAYFITYRLIWRVP